MSDENKHVTALFSAEAAKSFGSVSASVPDEQGGCREIKYTSLCEDPAENKTEDEKIVWQGPRNDLKFISSIINI